jgi:formate hydrogenlyase subunit 3/multisubunit Na+/H+ antiporter MnhD subunit
MSAASLLALAAIGAPLLLALAVRLPGAAGRGARALAPGAALPALGAAVVGPGAPLDVPALLLGARLGLDEVSWVFLWLTSILWLAAGLYARAYLPADRLPRYFAFHLLTQAGNVGLVFAHDVATYYLFFALMTFAAYGLVVFAGDDRALRAGRVYLAMAVLGEALLLAGLMLVAARAASLDTGAVRAALAAAPEPTRGAAIALLLAGFAVKAGAVPLHMWLPLAHPVAPTPASAVLSGAMIKAGLLGWLRVLPLGTIEAPGWGALVLGLGLLAAVYAVVVGVLQDDPKTVLAYSSISQMGLINVAVGVALAVPARGPAALAAVLVYVLHHGLAKGALFLGVGVVQAAHGPWARRAALGGVALAALALAGAPLTSGSVAKAYLQAAAGATPALWLPVDAFLPFTAIGTALLMGRFLLTVARGPAPHAGPPARAPWGLWLPFAGVLAAGGGVAAGLPARLGLGPAPKALLSPYALWAGAWPVLCGLVLAAVAALLWRRVPPRWRPAVAPGDLLAVVTRAYRALHRGAVAVGARWSAARAGLVDALGARWSPLEPPARPDRLARVEGTLGRWSVAVAIVAALFLLLQGALGRG